MSLLCNDYNNDTHQPATQLVHIYSHARFRVSALINSFGQEKKRGIDGYVRPMMDCNKYLQILWKWAPLAILIAYIQAVQFVFVGELVGCTFMSFNMSHLFAWK